MSAPVVRKKEESRPATADSETSEACEERLLTFQKYFQDKNFAKFSLLKDAFRAVDKDKNGAEELSEASYDYKTEELSEVQYYRTEELSEAQYDKIK